MIDLFESARACLEENDVEKKILLSSTTAEYGTEEIFIDTSSNWIEPSVGRPARPKLVAPNELPKRGFGSALGRISLLHAIAHIEFNAINLAWDAIYRFQNMPHKYYFDWMKVAKEETNHFELLRKHLNVAGYDYGDFDAHNGLWTMAKNTAADVLHRMAIIPRVMEARGLDVTPAMISKFSDVKEYDIVTSLQTIYKEEIGHVLIGDIWFRFLCEQRGLNPETTFIELIKHYQLDDFRGSLNKPARVKAGFSEKELVYLESEFVRIA